MSVSKTPCAACKMQRRKCTQDCVFAPYFPPDKTEKFEKLHQVFGASNISKILTNLDVSQRAEAVRSLVFEAEARCYNPAYGCVGSIYLQQQTLKQIAHEIEQTKKELALYEGPTALQSNMPPPLHPHHKGIRVPLQQQGNNNSYSPSVFSMPPQSMMVRPGIGHGDGSGPLIIREPQQQQRHRLGSQLGMNIGVKQEPKLFGIYDQQQPSYDNLRGHVTQAVQQDQGRGEHHNMQEQEQHQNRLEQYQLKEEEVTSPEGGRDHHHNNKQKNDQNRQVVQHQHQELQNQGQQTFLQPQQSKPKQNDQHQQQQMQHQNQHLFVQPQQLKLQEQDQLHQQQQQQQHQPLPQQH